MNNNKKFCDMKCPFLVKGINACLHPSFVGKSVKLKKDLFNRYEKICDNPKQFEEIMRNKKMERLLKKN